MTVSILQIDHRKPILGLDASNDALLHQYFELEASAGPDSRLADPGLTRCHLLSWVR